MKENQMKESRTINAVRNVIFNLGYQIVNTVVNIILPPLIIGKYGSAANGLISTVKQIISYVQLVGAGISESTVVSLYKPLAENDHKKISSIYSAVGKAFNYAGMIFSMIAIIIAFAYPFFVSDELEYMFIVQMVLILSISGISEFFALGKYRSLLIADQKIFVVNIAQSVGAVASTVLAIILILLDCSILLVQLMASLAYVMRIIILYFYIHKNYGYIDYKAVPDNSATSKRKAATVHQLASLIMFGSQSLIIASFCGLAEASVYSVYNLIFTGINTILSTVSSAMLASMGNLIASDDAGRVKKVYSIYELGYYILVFSFYITTLVMIVPFVELYTQGITDAEYIRVSMIFLFIVMGLLNCVRTPGATMINAKGHYDETKNRALIEMSICIVGQFCLVGALGIEGVIIGTILAYGYRTIDVVLYSNCKVMGQTPLTTLRRILVGVGIMVGVGFLLGLDITTSNYFVWIIYAMGVFAVTFIVVVMVNWIFDKRTLKNGIAYVKEIVKGGRRHAKSN